jgi:hypothetical protein
VDGDGALDVLSASFFHDTIAWYEQQTGTDPTNADTDGDGLLDGSEVANGYDPLTATSLPPGYINANGYVVGPGVDLTGANLAGVDLTGVDLTGVTLGDVTIVTGVSPDSGPATGNIPLTLSGSGFGVSGTVTVDGSLCLVLTYTNTEITCDLPPGVGPSVPVVVLSNVEKTSNTAQFAYLGAPPAEVPGLGAMMQALLALLLAMLGVRQFGCPARAKH